MSDAANSAMPGPERPIKDLRIRFWGVQGSCPLFPEAHEVAEYKRMVTLDVIERVLDDVKKRSHDGVGATVEDILGGPANPERLEAFRKHLTLQELPVYGGDTTCASVETPEGDTLVLDGGSGIRNCSKFLMQRWPKDRPREMHLLGTHEHLDHRSGLPFSQFCYVRPPFTMNIYGGYQFLHALDVRYGIFSRQINATTHLDDPIDYRAMNANFKGHELRNPQRKDYGEPDTVFWEVRDAYQPLRIGQMTITVFEVYHGTVRCLAYKIQHGKASFIFCTDHEVRHGLDPNDPRQAESAREDARLSELCRGVDAIYCDGQYFRAEYDGKKGIGSTMAVSRVDWGHGCIEDIVERTIRCGIPHVLIGHHDPERTWVGRLEVDRWLAEQCKGKPYKIELAKSEDVLDL